MVAEDRYAARDALELIDVEYEPLPPVIDAARRSTPDAPVIRDDLPGRADNHIFDWEAGDEAADRRGVRRGRRRRRRRTCCTRGCTRRRWRPAARSPTSTRSRGKLTVWSTSQAPHAHRTLYALVAGHARAQDPGHLAGHRRRLRQQGPDLPGLPVRRSSGSMVTGRPVKWIEDRSENLMSTSFARDYHMHGEIAATQDGKILGLRVRVLADHGAFNGTAQPTKFPAGFFHIFTGSYDLQAAHCAGHRRVHEQGARRRGLRLLVPHHRGRLPGRADGRPARLRARHATRPSCGCEPAAAGAVPLHLRRPAGSTTPATTRAPCGWPWTWPATTSCAREQAEQRERGEHMGIGLSFFTEAVGAGPAQAHGHPRPGHGRRR